MYGPQAIPTMAFHRVNKYLLLVCVTCVEYFVKDVASFQSQLMGIVHKRTAPKLYRPAGRKLLVAYVETGRSS